MQEKNSQQEEVDRLKNALDELLDRISGCDWRNALVEARKHYNIRIYNIEKLSPKKVKSLYLGLTEKFYLVRKVKSDWVENELRIYVWLLICYGALLGKELASFELEQWQLISGFFLGKSAELCEFQFYSLKNVHVKHEKWSESEDDLLVAIIQDQQNTNKWNKIAKELFLRSSKKYFRTAKQCRERWNNYLDPAKCRGEWTSEEDYFLINFLVKHGKKWAAVAKGLPKQRTEHMVKNRFKTLLVKLKKDHKIRKGTQEIQILRMIERRLKADMGMDRHQIQYQASYAQSNENAAELKLEVEEGFQYEVYQDGDQQEPQQEVPEEFMECKAIIEITDNLEKNETLLKTIESQNQEINLSEVEEEFVESEYGYEKDHRDSYCFDLLLQ